MKTLLKIFFYPYLQFMLKMHIYVFIALFLFLVLQVKEVVYFGPQLYGLVIYMFMGRHTFKQNISWMLSSFNKKTLVQYHLISQTFMMVLLFCLNIGVGLIFAIVGSTVMPKEKETKVNLLMNTATEEIGKSKFNMADMIDSIWSTRETIWIYFALLVVLFVIYSPVNAQEQFKRLHERKTNNLKVLSYLYVTIILLGFLFVQFSLHEYMILIMSLLFTAGICYIVYAYNNVFLFIRLKNLIIKGAPFVVMIYAGLNYWMYHKSLDNFHSTSASNRKVRELLFLGPWSPKLSQEELLDYISHVDSSSTIEDLVDHSHFRHQLPLRAILEHFEAYPTPVVAGFITRNINQFNHEEIVQYKTKESIEWLSSTSDEKRKMKPEEVALLLKKIEQKRTPAQIMPSKE